MLVVDLPPCAPQASTVTLLTPTGMVTVAVSESTTTYCSVPMVDVPGPEDAVQVGGPTGAAEAGLAAATSEPPTMARTARATAGRLTVGPLSQRWGADRIDFGPLAPGANGVMHGED